MLKNLFTNNKFFLAMTIAAVIGPVYEALKYICPLYQNYQNCLIYIGLALCQIVLYNSYKKHEKNVMKGIMGSLLMALFVWSSSFLSSDNLDNRIIGLFLVICILGIAVNHFIINSEHHSKPVVVNSNQIFSWLFLIGIAFFNIRGIVNNPSVINIFESALNILSMFGSISTIISVESRLDLYRKDREDKGWTEEKGYPENYVHQYMKEEE